MAIIFCEYVFSENCDTDDINDEEETIIQMTVDEFLSGKSVIGSINFTPVHKIHTCLLFIETSLMRSKGIVSSGKLMELLGKKCRNAGCNEDLVLVNVHSKCGYALKLEWRCNTEHRSIRRRS